MNPNTEFRTLNMSLRDTFACHALAGMGRPSGDEEASAFAREAYTIASAMLAERRKRVRESIAAYAQRLEAAAVYHERRAKEPGLGSDAVRAKADRCRKEAEKHKKQLEEDKAIEAILCETPKAVGPVT